MSILLWHRTDLRIKDNRALRRAVDAAEAEGVAVQPVFVFDPAFYESGGLACDARIAFLHECLRSLRRQYRDRDSELLLCHGTPEDRLAEIAAGGPAEKTHVYYTRHPTARHGARRDRRVADRLAANASNCTVEAVPEGGMVFDAAERGIDSREGWAEQCEAYFDNAIPPIADDRLVSAADAPASSVTIDDIEGRYDIASSKASVPHGGHRAARRRLDWFARTRTVAQYPGSISPPADAKRGTSRLSPYLRFGVLSPREVYRAVVEHAGAQRARELFESRLFWNRHFRQKLADNPQLTEQAVNPVFRDLYRNDVEGEYPGNDPQLIAAWKEGRTGFPMVDASMRALVETGWLNFRMRAMVASFFGYILKQWWRIGADFMYYHLIDADPAINYAQWQMQCGLVGCHPNRIYNPRKQVRENDPEGEFVYEHVPELCGLPSEFLPRPERAPMHVQRECGVEIGDGPEATYPRPVVDFEHEATLAREQFGRLAEPAREALADPAVRRRASLSRKRRQRSWEPDEDNETEGNSRQERLSSY